MSESDEESIDTEEGGGERENKRLPSIIHYYSVVFGTYIIYDIRVRIPRKTSEGNVVFAMKC